MTFPVFTQFECPLVPGPGWWVSANDIEEADWANFENAGEAKEALGVTHAGPGLSAQIVQPAIPCMYPKFPLVKGEPVIQVPFKGTESPYATGIQSRGFQSGMRSVIIGASKTAISDWIIAYDTDNSPIYANPDHPEFYVRFKGCGMWIPNDPCEFPGFSLRPIFSQHHPDIETMEVRGTSFPVTASIELVNTPQVNAMLRKFGLNGCNTPLGMWYFGKMRNDPAPNVPKASIVMKTCADMRYESHLLAGLEIMLREKLSDDNAMLLLERIRSVYFKYGVTPSNCLHHTYKKTHFLNAHSVNEFMKSMIGKTCGGETESLSDASLVSAGFCPSYDVYRAVGDDVRMSDGSSVLELVKLVARLGWEVGRCIAVVHRAGFNWGKYLDHSYMPHDDAHANNVCVLPHELMDIGEGGKFQLLCPTDFDMTFKREHAVDVWRDVAVPDTAYVDEVFSSEFRSMMMDVAGYCAALEFKGEITVIEKRDPAKPSPQMDLIWVMRDLAVWEYIHGYLRPGDDRYSGNDITLAQALRFIPAALEMTRDVVV